VASHFVPGLFHRYSLAWTHLLAKALSPADSAALISELLQEDP